METPRRSATSSQAVFSLSITVSRRAASMSRMSVSRRTREGMLLTAPGKTSHTPDCSHGVDGAGGLGCGLKRQHQLGGCGERVLAAGHQLAAGVAAFAFNEDAHAGRCGDVGDETEIDAFLLEQRALLDVQLDELVKSTAGQGNRFERTAEAGVRAQFFEAASFLVAQGERLRRRKHAGHHAAAQAADAEAGRLLGGEDRRVRSSGAA